MFWSDTSLLDRGIFRGTLNSSGLVGVKKIIPDDQYSGTVITIFYSVQQFRFCTGFKFVRSFKYCRSYIDIAVASLRVLGGYACLLVSKTIRKFGHEFDKFFGGLGA